MQQLAKAEEKTSETLLRAPVPGTVQQLAAHTVGSVATPAQPVLVVVPDNLPLIAEVMVRNDDAKARSQEWDKNSPPAIVAQVSLDKAAMLVEGVERPPGPGMAVIAEEKRGRKKGVRVMNCTPVVRHGNQGQVLVGAIGAGGTPGADRLASVSYSSGVR